MLFDYKLNKSFLRELIETEQFEEIPGTGRVYLESYPSDYVEMRLLVDS